MAIPLAKLTSCRLGFIIRPIIMWINVFQISPSPTQNNVPRSPGSLQRVKGRTGNSHLPSCQPVNLPSEIAFCITIVEDYLPDASDLSPVAAGRYVKWRTMICSSSTLEGGGAAKWGCSSRRVSSFSVLGFLEKRIYKRVFRLLGDLARTMTNIAWYIVDQGG